MLMIQMVVMEHILDQVHYGLNGISVIDILVIVRIRVQSIDGIDQRVGMLMILVLIQHLILEQMVVVHEFIKHEDRILIELFGIV